MTTSILVNGTGTLTPITLKKNYLNSIGTDSLIASDNEEGISFTSTGKTTNRYYYHTNQLGSVIAISTSTGLVVQKYSYNAHGKPYVSIGNALYALSSYTGTLYGNSRLYTGREFENDTGYYYNRARYYSSDLGRFISRDPIGQNDQVNLYTYVANSPLKYVDRMGREKQLLEDIKNGNSFFVELVARNLDSQIRLVGTHTFINIHSFDKNGKKKEYSIGGQQEGSLLAGTLVAVFNQSKDTVTLGGLDPAGFKESVFFDTPDGMTDGQFVQNIYNEYKDYNENHQVTFNLASKPFWGNSSGNCSNLATTLLMRASNNDKNISKQISNMDPGMFNWGLGEVINY